MAIASAATALTLARNAASAPKNERNLWLAGAVGVIAVGIWAELVFLDGASAASWRIAAIAAVVLSFLISAAATAASDKRFLSRALRRLSVADKKAEASKRTADWWRGARSKQTTDQARNPTPSDLLALNSTLTRAANSVLVPGDLESPSTASASANESEGDTVNSEAAQSSATPLNSPLPK